MATKNKEPMVALRTFKDSGTGKTFEQGSKVEATEGQLANYAAAGLYGVATAAQAIIDESHQTA